MKAWLSLAILAALTTSASAGPSAEQLYNEGKQAYDAKNYSAAISKWRESYDLSKQALLLLNLAQAYRLAGDCVQALAEYRRYLAADPTPGEQHDLATSFVTELTPKCGSPVVTKPDRVDQQVDRRSSGNRLKLAGLMTGGAGVAVLASGLLFGRRASTLGDDVTRDCAMSCDWATEKSKESDGKRYATIGKIVDGIGLAAIATGVGLYIYGAREKEPTVTIQPRPNGATLSWSGSW